MENKKKTEKERKTGRKIDREYFEALQMLNESCLRDGRKGNVE
jgi:hypothetical protein